MHLSSRFFYENGATADPLKFYQFMKRYAPGHNNNNTAAAKQAAEVH